MIIFKTFSCFSDARVIKTLKYLNSIDDDVFFSGAKSCKDPDSFFIKQVNYNYIERDNIFSLIKVAILDTRRLIKSREGDLIYVVNEQMGFFLLPMLFFCRLRKVKIILDLYDSLLLIYSNRLYVKLACRLLYSLVDIVIVTDQRRKVLTSSFTNVNKVKVVENFPIYVQRPIFEKSEVFVNLFFSGSLHETRGWSFIKQFANIYPFKVYLAGWNNLEDRDFILPDNFINLGLLNQDEILNFMNSQIHWIFCLYEPINENNLNASPNKIYDAIHTNCGIIINSEVYVSKLVDENNWGLVINNYYDDFENYLDYLISAKNKFIFSDELKCSYSFNQYEHFFKSLK